MGSRGEGIRLQGDQTVSTIALAVVSLVLYLAFVGFVWAEDTKH